MPTETQIEPLQNPTDQQIIDKVGELRTNDKIVVYCKSAAQWHDMPAIIKAEFPNTFFRISQISSNGDSLKLRIKVM